MVENTMRVLVVDDEPLARERLQRFVEMVPNAELVGVGVNGVDAVLLSERQHPDVLLIDIKMPVMDGLEAAAKIMQQEEPPAIIFCTAFEEHALEAFRVNAVNYLVKPIVAEQVVQALEDAKRLTQAQIHSVSRYQYLPRYLALSRDGNLEKLLVSDIICFRTDGKLVVAHAGSEVVVDYTLKELEDLLGRQFVRVHRSALVSVTHITRVHRRENGKHEVAVEGLDDRIDVSRRHLKDVKQAFAALAG
jgi:two-component system response regulator AlgR